MIKLAMISQPMNGLSKPEIEAARNRATRLLEAQGYQVLPTWFKDDFDSKDYVAKQITDGVRNIPIHFLSRAIEKMSRCDAVFFCNGWQNARGCRIEQQIAEKYDIETIYE